MPGGNLDAFFKPESIALIGASEKEGSVGAVLTANAADGYEGSIYPVNPKYESVQGLECFSAIDDLPETPDLAVIATPAKTVPDLVEACGRAGVRAAIIISAGFGETGEEGREAEERIGQLGRRHGMRIIGPNCLGIIRPDSQINLSFLRQVPQPGPIAFLSQSGAMGSAILDWAANAGVGFSAFVSVGNMVDVDFATLIDYFGNDRDTGSIVMYMESVTDAGAFMSAARAFARRQPILVIKAGKHGRSAEAVSSHTGALAGQDAVYDAAFRRAGVTRVESIGDLFIAAELLANQPLPSGPRLCVITNAGGPGILAADAVLDHGGVLAELSKESQSGLEEILPPHAAKGNPVDVLGDAGPERYRRTGEVCARDDNVDGLLFVYSPQGEAGADDAAQAVIDVAKEVNKPVLACWMGGDPVADVRRLLQEQDVPAVATPEEGVRGYLALHRHARNLELLYETPEELPVGSIPPHNHLKVILRQAADAGREHLHEDEAKQILNVYGLPVTQTRLATSAEEAVAAAEDIGYPVVLKVVSPGVTHKSDVGGVLLRRKTAEEVRQGFETIRQRVAQLRESPPLTGVSVQPMLEDLSLELILGAKRDPVFGATLLFGRGGTGVELYGDTAVGFPPLNQVLARRMIEETKVYRLLLGYRNAPAADLRLLEMHLVRFSQLVMDFPEITEIDINPLAVREGEYVALDARVVIDPDAVVGQTERLSQAVVEKRSHLVIDPYPREYVESWRLEDGRPVTLRPIRPEDEPLEFDLFDTFSEETWRQRFFGPHRDVSHREMTRYTNIDYRRTMAIVAILEEETGPRMIGVSRLVIDPATETGEYAVVVGDPWQGLGLGEKLTDKIIGVANDKKVRSVRAAVLKDNHRMLDLCRKMGFQEQSRDEDAVELVLHPS